MLHVKYHKADSNFQRITLPNEECSINLREMWKFAATPEKSSDAANEAMKNRAVFRSEWSLCTTNRQMVFSTAARQPEVKHTDAITVLKPTGTVKFGHIMVEVE